MPDLQSPVPDPAPSAPVAFETGMLPSLDDAEFAFGCECADPALHIAQWLQEARCAETGRA